MPSVETTYRHGVDAVLAKITDPDHLRKRSEAAGHRNVQVKVDRKGETIEVRLERDIESDIPTIAKKFVDAVNHVVDVIEYRSRGDAKVATFRVSVNKRIGLRGTIELKPAGDGCKQIESFSAEVDVPLVGRKIAELVEDKTATSIRADHAFTARALDGGA
jgi:hypothetical protein